MQIQSNLVHSSVTELDCAIRSVGDIILRHPNRVGDAQAIAQLRREINLALHAGLDPQFLEHEKKETH